MNKKAAIHKIARSTDNICILSGGAGTGKSTLLQELKQAALDKNKKVFAFAPSAEASRGALREKGFAQAQTVQMLLKSSPIQKQLKNQIMLIDEAGLMGIRSMQKVFAVAQKQNARVILVGDVRQHKSPSAGSALKILEDKAELPVIRVDKIVRQPKKSAYKKAVRQMADGKIKQGFASLDKMGWVKEIPDADKRYKTLAEKLCEFLRK